MLAHHTTAEARYILSHVYCVNHVPDDDGGVYEWRPGAGNRECCRCRCTFIPDLRLHLVSVRAAEEWCAVFNAFANKENSKSTAEA